MKKETQDILVKDFTSVFANIHAHKFKIYLTLLFVIQKEKKIVL